MERRAIAVHGTVQGVGFRPFVHELANGLGLGGFVKNRSGSVEIEVEGEACGVNQFLDRLVTEAPPLSRIDTLSWQPCTPSGDRKFFIHPSQIGTGLIAISPDAAVCDACLAEMRDPSNRRFQYPFINCTNCGPRLTIVTGAPYDRIRTTMAGFAMCPDCRAEYENPSDRRFHAQPIACSKCGPQLSLFDRAGKPIESIDPIAVIAEALIAGNIVAIKGIGGYHLACDAQNSTAITELRRRKHRYEKPLALMISDVTAAQTLCRVEPNERELLTSTRRPIVLLLKHPQAAVCDQIAPGNPWLGVMLPYAPLHHLLMNAVSGRALVMTSGNRSDEPMATDEPEVFERLAGIADLFLTHNRPIHVRCDDSVTRMVSVAELPIRRSRGYAPQSIRLPVSCPAPILAVGGQLKGTFGLGRDRQAILSHHLGDLDHFDAYRAFEKDIELYERLFAIHPEYIAYDLHPDYASTHYAKKRAAADGIAMIPIQHHHAHIASCMTEHGIDEPVIGVSFDGTGFGTDGAIWGGEFLVGDLKSFRRAAHLRYVPMPGSEKAITEPWRMAISHLGDVGIDFPVLQQRIEPAALRTVEQILQRRFNAPLTSSAGRLFDAVASLIGLRDRVTFEGQAAIQLELLASTTKTDSHYPFEITSHPPSDGPLILDTRPMIRAIVEDVAAEISPAIIARRFHITLVQMIVQTCLQLREITHIAKIVLSGGVFMNSLLTSETESQLKDQDLPVLRHRVVPPNDGGVSLGQLAIAARRIGESQCA